MSAAQAHSITAVARRVPPQALIDALASRFGDRFSTGAAICLQHGRDESAYPAQPPDAS